MSNLAVAIGSWILDAVADTMAGVLTFFGCITSSTCERGRLLIAVIKAHTWAIHLWGIWRLWWWRHAPELMRWLAHARERVWLTVAWLGHPPREIAALLEVVPGIPLFWSVDSIAICVQIRGERRLAKRLERVRVAEALTAEARDLAVRAGVVR